MTGLDGTAFGLKSYVFINGPLPACLKFIVSKFCRSRISFANLKLEIAAKCKSNFKLLIKKWCTEMNKIKN